MWEIDLADQITSFLLSILLGIILSVVFYTLESFRVAKRLGKVGVFVSDIFFFTVAGFVTFCFLIVRSNGEIRGYILLGELVGFWMFRLILSRFYIKILSFVISIIDSFLFRLRDMASRLLRKIYNIFKKTFKKLKIIRKKG